MASGVQDTANAPVSGVSDTPAPPQNEAPPDNLPAVNALSVGASATGQGPASQAPTTTAVTAPPTPGSGDTANDKAGSVQSARVVQGVAQSEMHIGFRSPVFGSVEVHTAVRDTQLGLSVSSERGDLRSLLAQEVPGLQTVFHQQGLQFDQIRFTAAGSGTGAGFSAGTHSHPNSAGHGRSPRSWLPHGAVAEPDTVKSEIQVGATRLSVHA